MITTVLCFLDLFWKQGLTQPLLAWNLLCLEGSPQIEELEPRSLSSRIKGMCHPHGLPCPFKPEFYSVAQAGYNSSVLLPTLSKCWDDTGP